MEHLPSETVSVSLQSVSVILKLVPPYYTCSVEAISACNSVTGCGMDQYSLTLHYGTDSRVATHYSAYHFGYAEVQAVNIAPFC